MDLSKLTPAPWVCPFDGSGLALDSEENPVADCGGEVDAEFIALARNAFEVMMRRGWTATRISPAPDAKWGVNIPYGNLGTHRAEYNDPFTALVEADAWYKANVERT